MVMKVLIIGGTGFVGSAIARKLRVLPHVSVTIASRSSNSSNEYKAVSIDATNANSIATHIGDTDVVINCMTGSADGIRDNASAIIKTLDEQDRPVSIIHMSTMSVYGTQTGVVTESTPFLDDGNWYGQAKIDAEKSLMTLRNHPVSILRIGCVIGPGSSLWVDRIGLLLRSGRLGNLADKGDGWSNLIHVDDIATVVADLLDRQHNGCEVFNLAAPDSPRWNDYFDDFAMSANIVPVQYKTRRSMMLESRLIAPPLKALERVAQRIPWRILVPHSIPPSLLRLWQQQIRLDSSKLSNRIGMNWTPYRESLATCVEYFRSKYGDN